MKVCFPREHESLFDCGHTFFGGEEGEDIVFVFGGDGVPVSRCGGEDCCGEGDGLFDIEGRIGRRMGTNELYPFVSGEFLPMTRG
jgi:hypothetical protein